MCLDSANKSLTYIFFNIILQAKLDSAASYGFYESALIYILILPFFVLIGLINVLFLLSGFFTKIP